jgi:hypothetical protein
MDDWLNHLFVNAPVAPVVLTALGLIRMYLMTMLLLYSAKATPSKSLSLLPCKIASMPPFNGNIDHMVFFTLKNKDGCAFLATILVELFHYFKLT